MSKCQLPARQVDAVIDGIAGKKLFDACNGRYLGSLVPDPTDDNKTRGEHDGVLSYGGNLYTCEHPPCPDRLPNVPQPGTPFTPGVLIPEGSGRLIGPAQNTDQQYLIPWPIGLVILIFFAIGAWQIVKSMWATRPWRKS